MMSLINKSMKEAIKSIGGFIIGIAIMVGLIFLVGILIVGGVALAGKIFPFLVKVANVVTVLLVFILVPMAFYKKTRMYAGMGMYFSSYIFGFTLWIYSALVAYVFWGFLALFIGLFLMGIGVLPIAFLASLFNGEWTILGNLVYMAVLTYGSRILGRHIAEKAEQNSWSESFQTLEENAENLCPNCGTKIKKSANFCTKCGEKTSN